MIHIGMWPKNVCYLGILGCVLLGAIAADGYAKHQDKVVIAVFDADFKGIEQLPASRMVKYTDTDSQTPNDALRWIADITAPVPMKSHSTGHVAAYHRRNSRRHRCRPSLPPGKTDAPLLFRRLHRCQPSLPPGKTDAPPLFRRLHQEEVTQSTERGEADSKTYRIRVGHIGAC